MKYHFTSLTFVVFSVAFLLLPSETKSQSPRTHEFIDNSGVRWKYYVDGSSAYLGSGNTGDSIISTETEGSVKTPQSIDGFDVDNDIPPFAFAGCTKITQVEFTPNRRYIPSARIGEKCFAGCTSLQKVVFPHEFITEGRLFENCPNLREIVFNGTPYGRAPSLLGCDSLSSVVFLGPPWTHAKLKELDIPLDGKIRFTREHEKGWRLYVEDNNISGWAFYESGQTSENLDQADIVVDMSLANYDSKDAAFAGVRAMSVSFGKEMEEINAEYENKYKTFLAQKKNYLMKLKAQSQQKGDFVAFKAFDNAIADIEHEITTDNKSLQDAYGICAQNLANLQAARDKKMAATTDAFQKKLQEKVRAETISGRIPLAGEYQSYADRISRLGDQLKKRAAQCLNSESKTVSTTSATSESTTKITSKMTFRDAKERRDINIHASSKTGSQLLPNRLEKGEIIVIQYVKGTYQKYSYDSDSTINPDSRNSSSSRYSSYSYSPSPVQIVNKATGENICTLPFDTETHPFAFEVPENGMYSLICYDNDRANGSIYYSVSRISKLKAEGFKSSPWGNLCQWK